MRSALAVVVAALLCVLSAPTAQAHSIPVSFSPAKGAKVDLPPHQVSITFNEGLTEGGEALTVTGPGAVASQWNTGSATIHGAILSTPIAQLGGAGVYTMRYRVTSADGHVVTGSSQFTLTRDAGGRPVARAAEHHGIPVWPFAAGAVVVLVCVVVFAVRRARGGR
ncbi:copper resistance protein CopC [Tsukamurella sp. 8F]|uniref:copper resistance CopC family protein n=1 Tax=unclassified Tsukamurella TaxID=2633480 RepID=UPI0023B8D9F7|nr:MULTISPECIES: copper resistance protein CopC [unclassified Tsukamurella]MDF0530595.1 copper resistance protein CopC [Tsukamurella sp. 8J]MDF0587796.1 copper resistance protein CopC [Tsukamurella sp. 8F]